MKKHVIILTFILVFIYFLLSFLDRKGEYAAEQLIWKANQKYFKLVKDPTAVPDKNFVDLDYAYEEIIRRFPNSPLSRKASLTIARIYLVKKDYKIAQEKAKKVLASYPQEQEISAEAMSIIGKSYELQSEWGNAVKIYGEISSKYPLTETGMTIPLYIALYYQTLNSSSNAQLYYQKAIHHYRELAQKYPHSEIGFKSLRLLSNCYFEEKMWLEGINTLGEILTDYSTKEYLPPQRADLIVKTINAVAITHLKNYQIPIKIYENFIEKHPKHGFNKILKAMIASLRTLESRNIEIRTKKE